MSITVKIQCRKHPKYMGYNRPRARWHAHKTASNPGPVCPGCVMVYNARHTDHVDAQKPWVRFYIVREGA